VLFRDQARTIPEMASDLSTRVKRKDPEMVCHRPSDSSLFSKTKKTRSLVRVGLLFLWVQFHMFMMLNFRQFDFAKHVCCKDGELVVFVEEKTATVQGPEPMECEEAKGELMDAEHERERGGRPCSVGDRGFHQLQEQSKAPDLPPNTAASLLWSGCSEEALFCISFCSCSVTLSNYCDRVLLRNGSSNSREEHSISVADIYEADASLGIEPVVWCKILKKKKIWQP
ncbi:hypothetical protein BHE74_00031572, partial [Ensete ventricosum]